MMRTSEPLPPSFPLAPGPNNINSLCRSRAARKANKSADYTLQGRNLSLKPWQVPPVYIEDIAATLEEVPDNDHRGFRPAAKMLQRMLSLGISRYEPDPVAAIADAEQRAALENDKPEEEDRPT
jgi:hypothetical protein